MKISIIVASFNSARTIRDTFESILAQTYSDYEVVVRDGGSTDGTLEIIKEFEHKFAGRLKWVSEPDNGIYDAMNKGIEMSTGDVVGILNSDDFYSDETVLSVISEAFSESETDAVCGDLVFVSKYDKNLIVRQWKGSPCQSFERGWHPAHPTFYVKRSAYVLYGLYDTSFAVSADFELMLRFIEKNKVKISYRPKCFVCMREGGESTGSVKKILIGNLNVIRAFKKNKIAVSFFYPIKRLVGKSWDIIKFRIK